MIRVDFHNHSSESNGGSSYEALIEKANQKNLKYFAITDHDTCREAKKLKEYQKTSKTKLITGIEITTNYKRVHIIGLNFKDIDRVSSVAEAYALRVKNELERILSQMIKDGIFESRGEVLANAYKGHISLKVLFRALDNKGVVRNRAEAYQKYFAPGKKYEPKEEYMSIKDAINLIKSAGGIPILAHPYNSNIYEDSQNFKQELTRIAEMGIEGIEIFYAGTPQRFLKSGCYVAYEIAEKYNLLISAGSDYHFEYRNGKKSEFGIIVSEDLALLKKLA